jgi:hypothetical protein
MAAASPLKHSFKHLTLWAVKEPRHFREIQIFEDLTISFDGCSPHGCALYSWSNGVGKWDLTFHYKADITRLRTLRFEQVDGTSSYFYKSNDDWYNAIIIQKT